MCSSGTTNVLLPTKHLSSTRASIVIGASILALLSRPRGVSELWERYRGQEGADEPRRVSWEEFILAVDLLFALGAVDLVAGVIEKRR